MPPGAPIDSHDRPWPMAVEWSPRRAAQRVIVDDINRWSNTRKDTPVDDFDRSERPTVELPAVRTDMIRTYAKYNADAKKIPAILKRLSVVSPRSKPEDIYAAVDDLHLSQIQLRNFVAILSSLLDEME